MVIVFVFFAVVVSNDSSGAGGAAAAAAARPGAVPLVIDQFRNLLGGLNLPADGRPGIGTFPAHEAGRSVEGERSEGLCAWVHVFKYIYMVEDEGGKVVRSTLSFDHGGRGEAHSTPFLCSVRGNLG